MAVCGEEEPSDCASEEEEERHVGAREEPEPGSAKADSCM